MLCVAPFKMSAHLPSKYPYWPQATKGPAGSKLAAVASLWGALNKHRNVKFPVH